MYVHGQTTKRPATEAGLAAQRARNAALAAELQRLEVTGQKLAADVSEARTALDAELAAAKRDLSKARELLTKTIKEADQVRLQASRIKDAAVYLSELPEPVHGGRAGLEAATEEIIEYEIRKRQTGMVVELPKREPHPKAEREYRHGTRRRYSAGCRCVACKTLKATYNATSRKAAA